MSRFRWKPNPYRDQSNFCLQKRIWITINNFIYFTIQEEKTKAVQGRKNKKGGRKGDMPDEVSNNNSLKVSAHTSIARWRCDENLTKENSLVFFPGDHPCSNQPCPTGLSFT